MTTEKLNKMGKTRILKVKQDTNMRINYEKVVAVRYDEAKRQYKVYLDSLIVIYDNISQEDADKGTEYFVAVNMIESFDEATNE